MLGIFKHYRYSLSVPSMASQRVSFSSYPGFLSSEDDFYILEQGMVVMETTNGIFNMTLYDLYIQPESLMSWVRVIVANMMAKTGKEWTWIMSKYNSGTYNNQWMVVDYKLFTPGRKMLAPNTLWIGSQIPGYFESADVTDVVNKQGYWPSYNIPYFKDIYNVTGYPALVQKYGDAFSYDNCPRAKIFRQRQGKAQTLETMQSLMRYNDWLNDPLSLGCPLNQLASRADVAPKNVPMCRRSAFGAINAKIAQASWMKTFGSSIIAGPTTQSIPPFEWTPEVESEFPHSKHYGQPRRFDFDWFFVTP